MYLIPDVGRFRTGRGGSGGCTFERVCRLHLRNRLLPCSHGLKCVAHAPLVRPHRRTPDRSTRTAVRTAPALLHSTTSTPNKPRRIRLLESVESHIQNHETLEVGSDRSAEPPAAQCGIGSEHPLGTLYKALALCLGGNLWGSESPLDLGRPNPCRTTPSPGGWARRGRSPAASASMAALAADQDGPSADDLEAEVSGWRVY